MIKKTILYILILTITSILLVGCLSSVQQVSDNSIPNEENYLLYRENYGKKITLYFKEDIQEKYDYKSISLMQDNTMVFPDIKINKNNSIDNKIEIILNEYISNFNRIEMDLTSGNKEFFYVGQHYLENIQEIPGEKECTFVKSCSQTNNGIFECEFVVDGPCKDVSDVLCSKIKDTGFKSTFKQTKVSSEGKTFEYNAQIPIEYYKEKNLKNITFDVIFVHNKINDDTKYSLIQMYVPIDYTY